MNDPRNGQHEHDAATFSTYLLPKSSDTREVESFSSNYAFISSINKNIADTNEFVDPEFYTRVSGVIACLILVFVALLLAYFVLRYHIRWNRQKNESRQPNLLSLSPVSATTFNSNIKNGIHVSFRNNLDYIRSALTLRRRARKFALSVAQPRSIITVPKIITQPPLSLQENGSPSLRLRKEFNFDEALNVKQLHRRQSTWSRISEAFVPSVEIETDQNKEPSTKSTADRLIPDEFTGGTLSLTLSTIILAVSLLWIFLLALTFIYTVLHQPYADRKIISWCDFALLNVCWKAVISLTFLCVFFVAPFAYLFSESEGFPHLLSFITSLNADPDTQSAPSQHRLSRIGETIITSCGLAVMLFGCYHLAYSIFFQRDALRFLDITISFDYLQSLLSKVFPSSITAIVLSTSISGLNFSFINIMHFMPGLIMCLLSAHSGFSSLISLAFSLRVPFSLRSKLKEQAELQSVRVITLQSKLEDILRISGVSTTAALMDTHSDSPIAIAEYKRLQNEISLAESDCKSASKQYEQLISHSWSFRSPLLRNLLWSIATILSLSLTWHITMRVVQHELRLLISSLNSGIIALLDRPDQLPGMLNEEKAGVMTRVIIMILRVFRQFVRAFKQLVYNGFSAAGMILSKSESFPDLSLSAEVNFGTWNNTGSLDDSASSHANFSPISHSAITESTGTPSDRVPSARSISIWSEILHLISSVLLGQNVFEHPILVCLFDLLLLGFFVVAVLIGMYRSPLLKTITTFHSLSLSDTAIDYSDFAVSKDSIDYREKHNLLTLAKSPFRELGHESILPHQSADLSAKSAMPAFWGNRPSMLSLPLSRTISNNSPDNLKLYSGSKSTRSGMDTIIKGNNLAKDASSLPQYSAQYYVLNTAILLLLCSSFPFVCWIVGLASFDLHLFYPNAFELSGLFIHIYNLCFLILSFLNLTQLWLRVMLTLVRSLYGGFFTFARFLSPKYASHLPPPSSLYDFPSASLIDYLSSRFSRLFSVPSLLQVLFVFLKMLFRLTRFGFSSALRICTFLYRIYDRLSNFRVESWNMVTSDNPQPPFEAPHVTSPPHPTRTRSNPL